MTVTSTSAGSDPLHEANVDRVTPVYGVFLRLIAIVGLFMGLVYWAQLMGMMDDQGLRYDLLDTNARIAYTSLAVCLPFAALGLWFKSSWGVVVWAGCASLQLAMHSVWQDEFGRAPALLIYAIACGFFLLAFNIWFLLQWRAERLTRY